MSANLVFVTGPGNMMLPFVVVMYKATCIIGRQTHIVIPCQGVHVWIRLAWGACEAAAAFAVEPTIRMGTQRMHCRCALRFVPRITHVDVDTI